MKTKEYIREYEEGIKGIVNDSKILYKVEQDGFCHLYTYLEYGKDQLVGTENILSDKVKLSKESAQKTAMFNAKSILEYVQDAENMEQVCKPV